MALDQLKSASDPDAARARAGKLIDWVLRERVIAQRATHFMHRLCEQLIAAGLPLDRVTLHTRQLHPLYQARGILWDREAGGAVERSREHGVELRSEYLNSPLYHIYEYNRALHLRLDNPARPPEMDLLKRLAERGYTDYAIRPVPMTDGRPAAISIATKRTTRFSRDDVALIDAIIPALGAVLELAETRRMSRQILNTYVGRNAGNRVLRGRIRLGDSERLNAVLWYCDLRGFTRLSEAWPLDKVIDVLNHYFACVGDPIEEGGGEILKFVGDGVLAIFTEGTGGQGPSACRRALTAAFKAQKRLDPTNRDLLGCGLPEIEFGLALHVGEVLYGNIGYNERLDFTVIGPSVNVVTRLEDLCALTGEPIILSDQFVKCSSLEARLLGSFPLKGIGAPQAAYVPAHADVCAA